MMVRARCIFFGISMSVLGALGVVYGDFMMEWTRTPDFLPTWKGWFYLHGAVLGWTTLFRIL